MIERWAPVLGWEGLYEVSTEGAVRSLPRLAQSRFSRRNYGGNTLRTPVGSRGYPIVSLSRDGAAKQVFLHKIVLEAFLDLRPPGTEACHANGVRTDARLVNLRWDTRKANHADKRQHGTAQIGERANNVKLTEAVVREIRNRGLRPAEAVHLFGLSKTNAKRIVSGETWKHVKTELSCLNETIGALV